MDNPFIKYNKSNDYVMGDLKKLSSSYIPDNFPHRGNILPMPAAREWGSIERPGSFGVVKTTVSESFLIMDI